MPLSVFHFDCFWMREFHWCDFEWDPRRLPRPARRCCERLKDARAAHLRLDQPVHRAAVAAVRGGRGGRLPACSRPDGSVWQWDMWQAGMALVDFTNPAAREWYAGKLRGAAGHGRGLLQDRLRRADPDRRRLRTTAPTRSGCTTTTRQLYNQTVFELLRGAARRRRGRAVRPLGHGRRPAVPGALGRRLRVDLRVDGGDAARRAVARAVRLRLLEPRHRRLRGHARPGGVQALGGVRAAVRRTAGCTAASSYRVPWLFDEEAVDVLALASPSSSTA